MEKPIRTWLPNGLEILTGWGLKMGSLKNVLYFPYNGGLGEQYAYICYFGDHWVYRPLEISLETCFEEYAKSRNIKSKCELGTEALAFPSR